MNEPVIPLLYVNDLLLTRVENLIIQRKRELDSEFHMKDLGLMHYYLGLEVWQNLSDIFLGQEKYIIKVQNNFGKMVCKSMPTPMVTNLRKLRDTKFYWVDPSMYQKLIGSLMYLVNTRSDIFFVMNTLS